MTRIAVMDCFKQLSGLRVITAPLDPNRPLRHRWQHGVYGNGCFCQMRHVQAVQASDG